MFDPVEFIGSLNEILINNPQAGAIIKFCFVCMTIIIVTPIVIAFIKYIFDKYMPDKPYKIWKKENTNQ